MANDDNLTLYFSWCSPTLTSKYFSKQLGLHLGSQSSQTFGPQYWGFQTAHWSVRHKNANDTGVFTTASSSLGVQLPVHVHTNCVSQVCWSRSFSQGAWVSAIRERWIRCGAMFCYLMAVVSHTKNPVKYTQQHWITLNNPIVSKWNGIISKKSKVIQTIVEKQNIYTYRMISYV